MLRRVLMWSLSAGLLGSTAFLVAPAHAVPATQSTTCSADLIVRFKPGLTFSEQSQQIKGSGSLSGCVGGGVTDGTGSGSGSGMLSCTSGTATVKIKITWNTGETSGVMVSVDVGNGSVTGTVVFGKFAGENVTGDLTLQALQGDCLFDPVTRAEATGTVSL